MLSLVAPHHCYSCNKRGVLLCDNCKNNITDEPFTACVLCNSPVGMRGICSRCSASYDQVWCVGEREGILRRAIDDLKFNHVYQAAQVLAELLDDTLPILPSDTVISYVPTTATNVRIRGYDQSALVAKRFARKRKLPYQMLLRKVTSTHQRGASRSVRLVRAEQAFEVSTESIPRTALLIDDIITTGATVEHASRVLRTAGTSVVLVAALAKQPLDQRE